MYNIIFIFIFVLGKTLGTGNNKPSDKEGSSNPYGTGYNLSGYYLPYPSNPFNVGQGAHSGYTGDYLHSYNSDVNTFHGAGINTHFNQYNQGIPSEQQINTSSSNYLEGLGEMFKNLPPSVIVPPTSSASNNIIQSSLPNLSSNTDYLPTNYQNVDHSVQYPYNSNNIPPPYSNQYSGGYSTSAVQNNDFHRGMSQSFNKK
ncbi:hypothetical protein Mgra_00007455 [Meloidogyne graminicola]|uniref:Uncharacterized protein n=1 Tax=Meloidogyne graminicola TaxID=189291 RepID=A0A8S9ZIQ1_9BILA|nr:hypothetical protein Mgra_00007455 [Meloidogyne graminicola]